MDILVSGAGIAGLACATLLSRGGHQVTVVESAQSFRLTGTPIDIRGDAIEAVDSMGLLANVLERRIRMSEHTQFVDEQGAPIARLPIAQINDSADDIELLRGDLVRILAEAVPSATTVRFGDSVVTLSDDGSGVDVGFASGRTGRHDVVLGADGQYSGVRRLVFGPDGDCLRHLGVYFALAEVPAQMHTEDVNSVFNVPGRMAGLFRYRGTTAAIFQFRSAPIDYDHRDVSAQKNLLVHAFAGIRSWRIPELLEAACADPGFYLTAAGQIHLPTWHRGRVALIGDAGYCPAFLSGRGTSAALTGARFLAEELGRCDTDPSGAFARYEARQRPYVTVAQKRVANGRDRILPSTWADIAARNAALQAQ